MGRLRRLIRDCYEMPEIKGNSACLFRERSVMGWQDPHVKAGDSDVIGGCVMTVDHNLVLTACIKPGEHMFACFAGQNPDDIQRFKRLDNYQHNFPDRKNRDVGGESVFRSKGNDPSLDPDVRYKSDIPEEIIEAADDD